MTLINDFSSYWTMVFLSEKSADIILKVFKAYYIEAERQTGQKLKKVWLDIGREQYNNTWKKYRAENKIQFEFTTPYTHQQNGVAEYDMCTILDAM